MKKTMISKGFKFTESEVNKIEELKGFFGDQNMSDTMAVKMIIKNYYNSVYIEETKEHFYAKVEAIFKEMEKYQCLERIALYKKAFERTIQELEAIQLTYKQTHENIFKELKDVFELEDIE